MSEVTSFGQWLRDRRKARDLTQEQLADKVHVAYDTIRKYESGERRPTRETAELFAKFFGLPAENWPAFVRFARLGQPGDGAASFAYPVVPRATATAPVAVEHYTKLPPQLTPFIGRAAQIEEVRTALLSPDTHLVTLTGPPGIGKTRLSIEVADKLAEAFRDGVCWVPLSPASEPAQVLAAIVRALGIKDLGSSPRLDVLKNYLVEKEMLLVLDNFEHVIAAASLVADLLGACPSLKVLANSREALHIYGEKQFPVPPMLLPEGDAAQGLEAVSRFEAVQLFVQHATAARPDFVLTEENAAVVVEICRRLDALPLAIELAAVRVKLLPPQSLLAWLDSSLALLSTASADLPDRQKTLRGAIDWSYGLLAPGEKAVLRRMSVFVGACSLSAIEFVMDDEVAMPSAAPALWASNGADLVSIPIFNGPGNSVYKETEHLFGTRNAKSHYDIDLLDTLTSLVDKSLIRQSELSGEPRFTMLWTLREYSQEKLMESGEENVARRQHALFFLSLAQTAEPNLTSADRGYWLQHLDKEHYNLLTTLEWCSSETGDLEMGLRLTAALGWYWFFKGYMNEGMFWLERIIALAGDLQGTEAWARALNARLLIATAYDSELPSFLGWAEQSVRVWRDLGGKAGLAHALCMLGFRRAMMGDPEGRRLLKESVDLYAQSYNRWGVAYVLDYLAKAEYYLGDLESCTRRLLQSLGIYRELGSKWDIGYELATLGRVMLLTGDYNAARLFMEEAVSMEKQMGDTWNVAVSLANLGDVAHCLGEYRQAEGFYLESIKVYQSLGAHGPVAYVSHNLAYTMCRLQRYERAAELIRQSLITYANTENNSGLLSCLIAGTCLALGQNQPDQAARMLGVVETLERVYGPVRAEPDHMEYEACTQVIGGLLARDHLQVAWRTGKEMSAKEAISYVLAGGILF